VIPVQPDRRHRRLRWRQAKLVALDFETTGLEASDEVVSFGAVPIDEGRIDLGEAEYREAAPTVPISRRSVTIHELRPSDLAGAPPIADAAAELARRLDGRFLLAWSADIEIAFLRRLYGGSIRRWRRRTIDVLPLAVAADRELHRTVERRGYQLGVAATRFGVPLERTHHALDDAFMTAELFLILATRLGDPRVSALLRRGRG